MDANIALGIVGIIINTMFFVLSMWWASVLNKRQIQATLQAAQPDAKIKAPRKPRKKVFGPKQRHVLKILRLMRRVIFISLMVSVFDPVFIYHPRNLYLDAFTLLLKIGVLVSGARAVLIIKKAIREVESGNRAVIDQLYNAFPPRERTKELNKDN